MAPIEPYLTIVTTKVKICPITTENTNELNYEPYKSLMITAGSHQNQRI